MNADVTAQMKILHLPDLVGGHPTALSEGERLLGAHSQALSLKPSQFGYKSEHVLKFQEANALFRWGERVQVFANIRNRYDVFHFNFGSSLLNANSGKLILGDLPFYPKNAVKVMTYQGSDARLTYGEAFEQSADEERRLGNGNLVDAFLINHQVKLPTRLAAIEKASRYCDHIFALNPDLLEYLPNENVSFLPYAIGYPHLSGADEQARSHRPQKLIHIVHLSTNRLLKGTGLIEKALVNLQKHLPFTFEIVFREDRPSALAALNRSDLVVDQLVLGWYGAAAVEAMYLAKPVIGYINPKQLAAVPSQLAEDLPIIKTSAETFEITIAKLLQERQNLEELGKQAKVFAQKWHSPKTVAKTTLATYFKLMR